MNTIQKMFCLLLASLYEDDSGLSEMSLSGDELDCIVSVLRKHDLLHLLMWSVPKVAAPVDDQVMKSIRYAQELAFRRSVVLEYDRQQIYALFEQNGIDYIPLKGAVIRELYPQPWHRTSCDIDVLIREQELSKAAKILCEQGYTFRERGFHDAQFDTPSNNNLELHVSILENMEQLDRTLVQVWEYAEKEGSSSCRCRLTNEFLLFHILSHMAYHFYRGGCGIRPLIDFDLISRNLAVDRSILNRLLDHSELRPFYNAVQNLANVWFHGAEHDGITRKMENFIVVGGVYGARTSGVLVTRAESDHQAAYLLKRLFPPIGHMRILYPILNHIPFLLPICWIIRIVKQLFNGSLKGHVEMAKFAGNAAEQDIDTMRELMTSLGIFQKE